MKLILLVLLSLASVATAAEETSSLKSSLAALLGAKSELVDATEATIEATEDETDLLETEEEDRAGLTGRRRRRRGGGWGHGHNPHGHHPHGHNPHRHNPHRHSPHRHSPHSHRPHSHNPHGHNPHSHEHINNNGYCKECNCDKAGNNVFNSHTSAAFKNVAAGMDKFTILDNGLRIKGKNVTPNDGMFWAVFSPTRRTDKCVCCKFHFTAVKNKVGVKPQKAVGFGKGYGSKGTPYYTCAIGECGEHGGQGDKKYAQLVIHDVCQAYIGDTKAYPAGNHCDDEGTNSAGIIIDAYSDGQCDTSHSNDSCDVPNGTPGLLEVNGTKVAQPMP